MKTLGSMTLAVAAALALSAYTTNRGLLNGDDFLSASMMACGTNSAPTTRSNRVPLSVASRSASTLMVSRSGDDDVSTSNSLLDRANASSSSSLSSSVARSPSVARVVVVIARRRPARGRARGLRHDDDDARATTEDVGADAARARETPRMVVDVDRGRRTRARGRVRRGGGRPEGCRKGWLSAEGAPRRDKTRGDGCAVARFAWVWW